MLKRIELHGNNKKRKTKRTKLSIKVKFRHMIATCMTLLSKHNKHATVSVKKENKDTTKNNGCIISRVFTT